MRKVKKPRYRARSEAQQQRFADPEERERHAAAIRRGVASAQKKARALPRASVAESWTDKTVRARSGILAFPSLRKKEKPKQNRNARRDFSSSHGLPLNSIGCEPYAARRRIVSTRRSARSHWLNVPKCCRSRTPA